jgi:ABC-2 type transport system permease protein
VPVTDTTAHKSESGNAAPALVLAVRQVRFEHRSFWRNRSRAFFSFVMPLMLLVIFGALSNGQRIAERGNISFTTFFVPGILAYGIITATFSNLAASLALLRDQGVLKRMRGTPLPAWAYMAGRVGSSTLAMFELVAVTLAVGWIGFGTQVRASTVPGLVVALLAGMVCFTALGVAVTAIIPNADAAQPVTAALVLPLTFISGIFFVSEREPHWLSHLAAVFPVKALADALQFAYNPHTPGAGVAGHDLVVLGLWAAAGVACLRFFRWEPNRA